MSAHLALALSVPAVLAAVVVLGIRRQPATIAAASTGPPQPMAGVADLHAAHAALDRLSVEDPELEVCARSALDGGRIQIAVALEMAKTAAVPAYLAGDLATVVAVLGRIAGVKS